METTEVIARDSLPELERGRMYHVTVQRPARGTYTYRWAEYMKRDRTSAVPWLAFWQHQVGKGRSVVVAASEVIRIREAG